MTRIDRCALLICLVSLFVNGLVANRVFENIPHLEDESTLVWQAEVLTHGHLWVVTPPSPASFLVPFVVDYHGYRFGKYPLGFPVLLSFGIRLGLRDWVNPFIAAWTLWLIYLLGKKILDQKTALLAVFLTASSPFFLINSGNLLTHAWSLFLSVCLALAWIDTFFFRTLVPRWLTASVAGLTLGALALTRPWTAVGVALPFFIHGMILLWKGTPSERRCILAVGFLAGSVASIHFLWQAVLTGSPWINPYTLWWPSDQIGFGPDIGFRTGGHTVFAGIADAAFSLVVASHDLFGWPWLSWIFLPFGIHSIRGSRPAQWVSLVFPALVLVYVAYWVGAWVYGPRYYYESLYSLTLLSAAGITWIYRHLPLPGLSFWRVENRRWPVLRFVTPGSAQTPPANSRPISWLTQKTTLSILFTCFLGLLIAGNLFLYIPLRVEGLNGLYKSNRVELAPFNEPKVRALAPALIIVHDTGNFHRYVTLTQLASPTLDSAFIFALSRDPKTDQSLAADFPNRQVYHYYPDKPGQFFLNPIN